MSESNNGFKKDCIELINNLKQRNDLSFQAFCEEWREMNFEFVFSGFQNDIELVQNVKDFLQIIKNLFLLSGSFEEQVHAFYLLYAIYFKQPAEEYCKIRVIHSEWEMFNAFYKKCCRNKSLEPVKYIYWKMFAVGAFLFVEHVSEYTLEHFMSKDIAEEKDMELKVQAFKVIFEQTHDSLMDTENGLVPALDMIQEGYNEMKDILDNESKIKTLSLTSIMSEIHDGLNNLSSIFELIPDNTDDEEDIDGDDEARNEKNKKGSSSQNRSIRKRKIMAKAKSIKRSTSSETITTTEAKNDTVPAPQKSRFKIEFDDSGERLQFKIKDNCPYRQYAKVSKSWKTISSVSTEGGDEFNILECDDPLAQAARGEPTDGAGRSLDVDLN